MAKKPYEFADTFFQKEREEELEEREEKERTKIFKVCPRCGKRKSISNFSVDKRNTAGRTNICKACKVIEYLRYYYENRNRILIVNKKYRDTHQRDRTIYYSIYQEKNREKLSKLASEWYHANKEAIKKRNIKYFEANKEACLARKKLWVEKNREKIRKYNREYKRKHR